jgi:hypothetical protein
MCVPEEPSAAAAAGKPDDIAAATARPLDGARDALLGLGTWDDYKASVHVRAVAHACLRELDDDERARRRPKGMSPRCIACRR